MRIVNDDETVCFVGQYHELWQFANEIDRPRNKIRHIIEDQQLHGLKDVLVVIGETFKHIESQRTRDKLINLIKYRESQGWFEVHYL